MMKRTLNNHDPWEVMSALQKSIRRSDREAAMYWAFELAESGYMKMLLSRLRVIAHEDIGIGDMTATLFSLRAVDDTDKWFEQGKGSWKMGLANAVMALANPSTAKCRDADNLQVKVLYDRRTKPPREIPDFALDKHTKRGKMMGRGIDHFLKDGTFLFPIDLSDPKLRRSAEEAFRYRDEHGLDPKTTQEAEKDPGKTQSKLSLD